MDNENKVKETEQEKTWCMWTLSQDDIVSICQVNGIPFRGKNLDYIANSTKKGIERALEGIWDECIKNGAMNTETEWTFEIKDVHEISRSEKKISDDRPEHLCEYERIEISEGTIIAISPNEKEPISAAFRYECHVTQDNGGDGCEIISEKPEGFTDDEWDNLKFEMEDFIHVNI